MDPRLEELTAVVKEHANDRANAEMIADDLAIGRSVNPVEASNYLNILLLCLDELHQTGLDAIKDVLAELKEALDKIDFLNADIVQLEYHIKELEDATQEIDTLKAALIQQQDHSKKLEEKLYHANY